MRQHENANWVRIYEQSKGVVIHRTGMPEVISRREIIDDRETTFVYDARSMEMMQLKGVADDIWRALDGSHTLEHIVKELCDKYTPEGVDRERILKDAILFINKLGRLKLIRKGGG